MIMDNITINKLKHFGLNSYEAKIWVALLSKGISTAGELAEISNVPRSRAYDVLESLEKKGFIVMKIGKPIKYIAVPPSEVIERVKKDIKEKAETQEKLIENLKQDEMVKDLDNLFQQGIEVFEPTELTGSLKDRTNLYHNLNMMIKSASKSVDLITTEEGIIRKAEALKKSLAKAKKRNVSIRIAAPITKKTKNAVEKLSEVAEIRHVNNIKARFCIVDEKEVTFSLMDDEKINPSYDSGVWVNTKFFANALKKMFEQVWENSIPTEHIKETSIKAKKAEI